MAINGLAIERFRTFADAIDAVNMLVRTGRAVPEDRWVEVPYSAGQAASTFDSIG